MILLTIVTFLIILSILVLVHELGHFLTARFFGVKVEEFGLGLPPRILGAYFNSNNQVKNKITCLHGGSANSENTIEKNRPTVYSLNWIPLGGFVKIKGEQGEGAGESDSFISKPLWQRGIILAAGVTMNLLFTMVILSVGFILGMPQAVEGSLPNGTKLTNSKIIISEVLPQSPAARANLKEGDIILTIDGQALVQVADLQKIVSQKNGQLTRFEISRDNQTLSLGITPEILPSYDRAVIGVGLTQSATVAYPWYLAPFYGIKLTFLLLWEMLKALGGIIISLFTWQKISVDAVGPVGIAVMTGSVVKLGFVYVLQFMALLSLTLAVMNFLPFPALDGGRFLFIVLEKIRGKGIDQKIENTIHGIGYLILLLLIAAITVRDISRWQDKFVLLWHKIINLF